MTESARAVRRSSAAAAHALVAVIAIAVVVWCIGCAGDADHDGETENDNAASEAAVESPVVQDHSVSDDEVTGVPFAADERDGAQAFEYDWEPVSSVGTIRGTRVLMDLLRHLDRHHEGRPQTIHVTWQEPGHAVDGSGQTLPIFAEEWKGVIDAIVNRAQRDEEGVSRWRAMPSGMYNDGFGEVTRHEYRVFIESYERLRLESDGPVE